MRYALVFVGVLAALFAVLPLGAEEVGRFTAISAGAGVTLFLDTQKGHIWRYVSLDGSLNYEGQLRPPPSEEEEAEQKNDEKKMEKE